jgi:hypothetical protein
MLSETDRAFEQERQADLVIDYESSDRIWLTLPAEIRRNEGECADETLAQEIAGLALKKRALAVVVIGKPVRYQFAGKDELLRAKVDAIEAVVKGQGFKRVIFQLASATGRPIYRE